MTGLILGPLRRDRLFLISALLGISLLAWAYTFYLANQMPAMDTSMDSTSQMSMAIARPWQLADFGFNFLMWTVMMIAMMTPTAMPMVLIYDYVARQRNADYVPVLTSGLFMLGYLIIWTVFSLAATLLQWGMHSALLLTDHMIAVSPSLGGILLVLAGIYQFTSLKGACLSRCRSPLSFLITDWREGPKGAFLMGLKQGAFCTGCCWLLMVLLFVVGVMNLLWVAAITVLVLVEKVIPIGQKVGRTAGCLLIVWGLVLVITVI